MVQDDGPRAVKWKQGRRPLGERRRVKGSLIPDSETFSPPLTSRATYQTLHPNMDLPFLLNGYSMDWWCVIECSRNGESLALDELIFSSGHCRPVQWLFVAV